jgi:iron(III) transport system permease protein
MTMVSRTLAIATAALLLLPLVALWCAPTATTGATGTAGMELAINWRPLVASLGVALLAAILAVAFGGVLAVLFSLAELPGARLWGTLLILAFACPPTVWALCQMYCYGQGGLVERWLGDVWRIALGWDAGHYLSTTLVLAQINAPLACLVIGRGARRLPQAGLEAASFHFRGWQLVRWLGGSLRQELLASLLLTFALAAGNFAVPHVLQCRLYPIEIYQRMTNYLDQAGAARAALPLVMPTLAAAAIGALVERRGEHARGASFRSFALPLGRAKWLALAGVLGYLFITTGLPLVALLVECQSLSNVLSATRQAGPEIENSLWIAIAAAVVATLAGMLTAGPRGGRAGALLNVVALLPIGIPPLIVALAYANFFNRTRPVDLSVLGDSSWLVILALGFRGWPFAARLWLQGNRWLAPEWHSTAVLAGMNAPRRWRWISAPLLADHVAAGAIVAYLLAIGDVEISQMLCAPGSGTLALRLFTFLHFGPTHVAASLAVVLMLLTSLPVWIYYLLAQRPLTVV